MDITLLLGRYSGNSDKLKSDNPKYSTLKRNVFILLYAFCFEFAVSATANAESYDESLVRAAVIFGILRFSSWPDQDNSSVIKSCGFGQSPASSAMQNLSDGMPKIGNNKLQYQRLEALSGLDECDVLVAGAKPEQSDIFELYAQLDNNHTTLMICDECDPELKSYASVNLVKREQRMQFQINLDRAEQQGVRFSPSLIELAASCYSTRLESEFCRSDSAWLGGADD